MVRLHNLKKKNAISRQEMVKAERDRNTLTEEISKTHEVIAKIKWQIERDEDLLRQGSKVIASAECSHLLADINEESGERVENIKQWVNDTNDRLEVEKSKYAQAFDILQRIQTFPNFNSINKILTIFQELVERKDETIKREQEYMDRDLAEMNVKKNRLEKMKEKLIEHKIRDQKSKIKLESFISRSGGSYQYPSVREIKGENAIQAAEAIMNKLKSKLNTNVRVNDAQPQGKKNVLHFDFRG